MQRQSTDANGNVNIVKVEKGTGRSNVAAGSGEDVITAGGQIRVKTINIRKGR